MLFKPLYTYTKAALVIGYQIIQCCYFKLLSASVRACVRVYAYVSAWMLSTIHTFALLSISCVLFLIHRNPWRISEIVSVNFDTRKRKISISWTTHTQGNKPLNTPWGIRIAGACRAEPEQQINWFYCLIVPGREEKLIHNDSINSVADLLAKSTIHTLSFLFFLARSLSHPCPAAHEKCTIRTIHFEFKWA